MRNDDERHLHWLKSRKNFTLSLRDRIREPSRTFGSKKNPFAHALSRLSSGECSTKPDDLEARIAHYRKQVEEGLPLSFDQ